MKRLFGIVASAPFNPEQGLTLTNSFNITNNLDTSFFNRSANVVFASDMTIPSSPVGLIHEHGATVYGCYIGFRSNNAFIFRSSDGAPTAPTTSGTGNAVIYLTTGQPSGKGTLVWEMNMSLARIRAWWNGNLLGVASATNSVFAGGVWAGVNAGAYFSTAVSLPAGEASTPLAATDISQLRYYSNQLVNV